MYGEEDFRVENTEKTERSHNDFCVLLLDSDATGLMNMSEILRKRGYRVVATTRADDLPRIINNQDEKIDLVLAEYSLVEMNKYGLFEKLKKVCEIPVVVAGEYVKEASMFYCLYRGARFYLNKPFMDSYLERLWQYKVWTLQDLLSQIESDPPVKKNLITHSQSLGDELKRDNQNNKVKTEELDESKGDYFQSGDQKKPELLGLEMQNESRQTDDENSKGNKRKERADTDTGEHTEKNYGSDLGDQKKPKLIFADDLQIETVEAIPNIEANNEREEPTETKQNGEGSEKEKPGLVCMEELENWSTQLLTDFADYEFSEFVEQDVLPMESIGGHCEIPLSARESLNKEGSEKEKSYVLPMESIGGHCEIPLSPQESLNKEGSEKEKSEMVCMEEELEKLSTQPVTDFTENVGYEFLEQDFLPLESIGESVGHRKIPLSPQESSNKEAVGQPQMQNLLRGFDEELIEDGLSLSDLEYDLQEGQGSTSDLELLEEIYNDLANVLKP